MAIIGDKDSTTAISLENVRYRYPKTQSDVIRIKQWQVEKGDHVFIHGRSGSGKTTLLNVLTGILSSQSKGVSIFGQNIADLSQRQRDRFRAKNIGVVFQQFNLVPYLSVLENIELAAYFAKTPQDTINKRYPELFAGLQLPLKLADQRADQLSVGQQQRVAIARALINQPQLLIVDEPTSALDNEAKHSFMTMLMNSVKNNNTTLIFVSHDKGLKSFFTSHISMEELTQSEHNHAV